MWHALSRCSHPSGRCGLPGGFVRIRPLLPGRERLRTLLGAAALAERLCLHGVWLRWGAMALFAGASLPRCRRRAYVTAGTIFEGTRKPLKLWFIAAWEITGHKYGANALTVKRMLGVNSYQTAWAWLHKFRRAMVRPGRYRLAGIVEVDESYVGGEEKGTHGRKTYKKAIVVIAVEMREPKGFGRIRVKHVPDVSSASLTPFVCQAVQPGSTVRPHRWLEGLQRRGQARLRQEGHRDLGRWRPRQCCDAGCAQGRSLALALAPRDLSRRGQQRASGLLPRRVHFPFQPPPLSIPRAALLSATRASRPNRPDSCP